MDRPRYFGVMGLPLRTSQSRLQMRSKWFRYSTRTLVVAFIAASIIIGYTSLCWRADQTPRSFSGRLVDRSGMPLRNVIVVATGPVRNASTTHQITLTIDDQGLHPSTATMHPDDTLFLENNGRFTCNIITNSRTNQGVCDVIAPAGDLKCPFHKQIIAQ